MGELMCGRHPQFPLVDCPRCEARIELAEDERDAPDIGGRMADAAAERYERWMESNLP